MKKFKIIRNNIKALLNYKNRKILLDNPPTFVWLEPTNHCNLRCIMCPAGVGAVNIQKGYMDYQLYKKIIDEIKIFTSAMILAIGGESFLHPQFCQMVKYASLNKIKVLLNTNATLLDKKFAHLLLDSGVSAINFAFDGFNKDTYEKARVGANFEKTLDNIFYFLKLRNKSKKKNPYTTLSILKLGVGRCSDAEKKSFLNRFEGLIDEIRLREVSSWGSNFKDSDKFSYKRYDVLWTPCSRLWSSICIAWNGDVIPCVYNLNHEYVLGNIKEERLLDIWNNQRLLKLRQAMIDGTYLEISPLCENCIVLGTPPLMGIPSGIRLTLSDAITNFLGYSFEKRAIGLANILKKQNFASKTIT